eukprot:8520199-Pyramimonas_sp.AAC.1
MDQSDAGSAGIFSRWTNRTHDLPCPRSPVRTCHTECSSQHPDLHPHRACGPDQTVIRHTERQLLGIENLTDLNAHKFDVRRRVVVPENRIDELHHRSGGDAGLTLAT